MISLLSRLFIKNRDAATEPAVRRAYVLLCSLFGISLNVLLFAGKYLAGVLSGSIAITADAFNNLSDAGSSVITLLGFKLAAKKPDTNHPFGHGRVEYLSGVAVSIIIIVVGFELAHSSIRKIFSPEAVDTGWLPMVILLVSIGVKFYMYAYNRVVGKKICSPAMRATAVDSLTDCAATAVVLLSLLVMRFTNVNIDGWSGAAVSLFILYSGITAVRDTLSPLLGNPPSPELVHAISDIVLSHPEIVNIHDLIVHDYGPGRLIISLHAEVPGNGDIYVLHDAIDSAERELHDKLGCLAVIHMDPISTDDSRVSTMRRTVAEAVKAVDPRITIHDFRIVSGPTHTNVIFDAVVPQHFAMPDDEVKRRIEDIVRNLWENTYPKVNIDQSYI